MEGCSRCGGLLAGQYDVGLRGFELRCMNCGARPGCEAKHRDGRPREAPLLCRDCGVNPRAKSMFGMHAHSEIEVCIQCREKNLLTRRPSKMLKYKKLNSLRYIRQF